jgi:hypothetical protein
MTSFDEEETRKEKSACGGPWAAGWPRSQRGQTARQQREWPQGRPGQKPQEDHRCPPQRASFALRPPEKLIETVIAAICARFGDCAIGLGDGGIRFAGSR